MLIGPGRILRVDHFSRFLASRSALPTTASSISRRGFIQASTASIAAGSAQTLARTRPSPSFCTMSSVSAEDLYRTAKEIVPELSSSLSKGDSGKVGTIGGCREYTGAPFFAASTALTLGSDLSHVFCTEGAATVIKSYSPELIVHPYLPDSNDYPEELDEGKKKKILEKALGDMDHWMERFDVVIIGPGLGRDPLVHHVVKEVIKQLRQKNKHMIIDADGLYITTHDLDLVKGYKRAILTPNKNEFARLAKELKVDLEDKSRDNQVQEIAAMLDGPTIVQKGSADAITNGHSTIHCEGYGSKRRSGGQGDVMTGCIATFMAWTSQHLDKQGKAPDTELLQGVSPTMLACYSGCLTARKAAQLAFQQKKRAMQAGDVITHVGDASEELWDKSG